MQFLIIYLEGRKGRRVINTLEMLDRDHHYTITAIFTVFVTYYISKSFIIQHVPTTGSRSHHPRDSF